MGTKLIIEGNSVYEVDEECLCQKEKKEHKIKAGKNKPASDQQERGGR